MTLDHEKATRMMGGTRGHLCFSAKVNHGKLVPWHKQKEAVPKAFDTLRSVVLGGLVGNKGIKSLETHGMYSAIPYHWR